jgi:hypothetical protein
MNTRDELLVSDMDRSIKYIIRSKFMYLILLPQLYGTLSEMWGSTMRMHYCSRVLRSIKFVAQHMVQKNINRVTL